MSYTAFSVGDRVELVDGYTRYKKRLSVGDTGTIRNIYSDNIAVAIDDKTNISSQYGYFYFERKQLKLISEKETIIMTGNYRIAEVQFLEGNNTNQKYHYACYDPSIIEGDICVVKTAHHGFSLAKVAGFITSSEELTREIVCKADFSDYNKRVESRKRMAELMDMMNAKAQQLQNTMLFKMLAKEDSDMAAMISEYEQLVNG